MTKDLEVIRERNRILGIMSANDELTGLLNLRGFTEEAKKIGNSRVFNLIVLGVAAQHMDFTKEQWYEVIEKTVPPKTIEINKKAFDVGYYL